MQDNTDFKNPFDKNRYIEEKEKSQYYQTDTNMFQEFLSNDAQDRVAEAQIRKDNTSVKKDARRTQWQGQLPYQTSTRTRENSNVQLIPESTKGHDIKVCFNDALDKSGPFYLRHWQIWDSAPFLPSFGDVTKDPTRTMQQTKGFTTEYKKIG